jgi:hypothetical protein
MESGFLAEAQDKCDKAVANGSYHKNINSLLARLRQVPEEEDEILTNTLSKVAEKAAFYRCLGRALLMIEPSNISTKWSSPEGTFELTVTGSSVKLFASIERPQNALFLAVVGGSSAHETVTHMVEYTGRLWGKMIVGRVSRNRKGEQPSSLLDLAGSSKSTLMHFTSDMSKLHVMENHDSKNPSFYSFKRVL